MENGKLSGAKRPAAMEQVELSGKTRRLMSYTRPTMVQRYRIEALKKERMRQSVSARRGVEACYGFRNDRTERAFTLECGPYDRPTVQEGGAL
jgi:hypothetical protein